jgi:PAS domain S-box-containing protein
VAGEPVNLTAHGFDILNLLLERRGEVIHFAEFARVIWGYEHAADHRFIQTAIWCLRRALDSAGARDVIENVQGVGYVIRGETPDFDRIEGWHSPNHPVMVVDHNSKIRFANPAAARLAGYSVEELQQMYASDIWRPGDEAAHIAMRELSLSNRAITATGLTHHRDGTVIPVEITVMPLALGTDEPLFLVTGEPGTELDASRDVGAT